MKRILLKSSKILFKVCLYLFAFIGLLSFFHNPNPVDICLDEGGVFDEEFHTCRFDCNAWQKNTGCEPISDRKLESFVNDYCAHEGKGLYRCTQSALELSKRKLYRSL